MKTFKLSSIMDFILGAVFVFLSCFVWARYFFHNLYLSLLLCSVVTFCIISLYYLIRRKKKEKLNLQKTELQAARDISTYFLLSTKQETINTFFKILSKNYSAKLKNGLILIDNYAVRPIYSSSEITDKDILESYSKIKNSNVEKIIICCLSASAKAKDIANIINSKKIEIYSEFNTYTKIFKPANFTVELPKKPKEQLKAKQRFLKYAQVALVKERTKSYFFVSIVLLFSSFVLRYNIYYLIFSTLTTILALYSRFNTKFNTTKKEQLLL